ncbi:MAG: DUF4422 domain-containing protein [Fusobacterium sp.]|uniref:DUF4422 domain-containing protein n=1 Tax=Fusobacterium sp. TaxID=68766 RepID=UPI002A74F166|nr:DUF4422 domain-containing protein [Fusobacterium sp.]MDY3060630.1 DUF4422 domain-containing protein [Fusobacterium sp.]
MNIKILVATHKKYEMPRYSYYLPLHVGKKGKNNLGYVGDDTGENISEKNPYYCELTGIYWAWKNLKADYIGLVHYRRQFKGKNKQENSLFDTILSDIEIKELLKEIDIILSKKRNYYIENLYDHYKHTMYIESLDVTGEIIKEFYPEYYKEFEKLHKRTSAHMFNMFIMKREYFDKYCEWLFDILEKLEKRVDSSKYDSFHARFYGRVSELLLDIWLETNNFKYKEVPVMSMEKVNWIKKGGSFLLAKFTGKKYGKSF